MFFYLLICYNNCTILIIEWRFIMKKHLLQIIIAAVTAVFMILPSTACIDEKSNTSTDDSSSTNQLQHYEIDLNKDNFEKYILFSVTETNPNSSNKTGNFYDFKGVLSYAYYKDVMITLNAQYTKPSWRGGESYNFNFVINLNTAGNFSFYTNNQAALDKLNWTEYYPGTKSVIVITAVSGKVIFNI